MRQGTGHPLRGPDGENPTNQSVQSTRVGHDHPEQEKLQNHLVFIMVPGDPLEEGMATHSGIFSWRIPWTEEPGGL